MPTIKLGSTWTVFRAFHWNVWLALWLTGFGVGVVLWAADQGSLRLQKMRRREFCDVESHSAQPQQHNPEHEVAAPAVLHGKNCSWRQLVSTAAVADARLHEPLPAQDTKLQSCVSLCSAEPQLACY